MGTGTRTSPVAYELKALTDIWTGDRSGNASRLITTGLLGSVRWWFEVLVRGLGGSACDPTGYGCRDQKHCVACDLFGCTGWAREFRFDVLGADGHAPQDQIKRGDKFQLVFTPLRPLRGEEWALLDATIRLIADYGAIGDRTVYKPSDEGNRQGASHHRDYGIVSVGQSAEIHSVGLEELTAYVGDQRWRQGNHGGFAWASLANFWCVSGRHLARLGANQSTFNRVIGRPEPKGNAGQDDSWLAGRRARQKQQGKGEVPPESKKVFSFKQPARTFGFTGGNHVTLDAMKTKLRSAWHDLDDADVRTGDAILKALLTGATP